MNSKMKTVFIVGPTASGKTSLAVEIAKLFNGEVVSADSMQIYKKMDIATAKPAKEEMQGIRHHMLDFVSPDSSYSVAKYKEDALFCIRDIHERGKLPVVCGGTGLYVDTLIHNTNFLEGEADEKLRAELFEKAEKLGSSRLWDELNSLDSRAAANIHMNNTKKIIRALEIYYITGKTLTEQNEMSRLSGEVLDSLMICLDARDRNFLYDRINQRVDKMVSDGLLREAEEFFAEYSTGTAVQAIGYKELKPYFDGENTLEECISHLKMQTRRYAKRQLTWFHRYTDCHTVYIDDYKNGGIVEKTASIIKEGGFA